MSLNLESITTKPRPESAAEYLESFVYFSQEVSPNNSGFLSLARQPWMREILDNVIDPRVKELTLCTGAQLGKSTLLLLATLLCVEYRQGTCLWLLPTDKMATRAVKKRLLPLISCNEKYTPFLPVGQVSYADSIPLKGFPVYYSGVKNAAKLASIPANVVICDEAAKFERGQKIEADPISLAQERTKSFADSLFIQASTPNVEESKFWQSYREGTRSKWIMPCPFCGEFMDFQWGRESVQWEDGQPETARLICPHCQARIDDGQRLEMLTRGKWIDENPAAREQGKLSYHLNSLYSAYITLGEMALKYHNAAHSLTAKSDLQNFTNSWLALPWTEHAVKVYDEDLQTCIDNMATRGLVPADYELLIMGIDVGQNQTHYVITALCQGGRLQVIDWGTLVSYKTENGQDGVAAIMDTLSYTNAAGDTIRPDLCLIDSGYDTQGVYEECLRATIGGTIIPVKGSNGSLGAWAKSKIRTMPYAPFELIVYSDYQLKRALYVDQIKNHKIVLPQESNNELLAGLSGQELKKTASGKNYWKEVVNDHYGDALKVAILAQWMMSADKLQ